MNIIEKYFFGKLEIDLKFECVKVILSLIKI